MFHVNTDSHTMHFFLITTHYLFTRSSKFQLIFFHVLIHHVINSCVQSTNISQSVKQNPDYFPLYHYISSISISKVWFLIFCSEIFIRKTSIYFKIVSKEKKIMLLISNILYNVSENSFIFLIIFFYKNVSTLMFCSFLHFHAGYQSAFSNFNYMLEFIWYCYYMVSPKFIYIIKLTLQRVM